MYTLHHSTSQVIIDVHITTHDQNVHVYADMYSFQRMARMYMSMQTHNQITTQNAKHQMPRWSTHFKIPKKKRK